MARVVNRVSSATTRDGPSQKEGPTEAGAGCVCLRRDLVRTYRHADERKICSQGCRWTCDYRADGPEGMTAPRDMATPCRGFHSFECNDAPKEDSTTVIWVSTESDSPTSIHPATNESPGHKGRIGKETQVWEDSISCNLFLIIVYL